jgi:tRNA dimethylallyltransferase
MERLPQVIAIVGPTSSGKSRLGLELAKRFDGEIVSADSRQIYRGLDIGTAKPSAKDQAAVPHHLIDIRDPAQDYSAAEFRYDATQAIDDIFGRGQLPIIVGGTGLYVRALLENLRIPEVPPNPALRAKLTKLSTSQLAEQLQQADANAAARIDLRNPRRIIRALEIREAGLNPAAGRSVGPRPYDTLKLGLNPDPETLKTQIERNVRERFANGLVKEVRGLLAGGADPKVLATRVIAYGPTIALINKKATQAEAIEQTIRLEYQYGKRQRTWFKTDSQITWLTDPAEAEPLVREWRHAKIAV